MQKCSSSCLPISSCGDGTVNCGEDCEPPNTATCDATCKSTCTNCANAKSMDKTSISLGETATGTICTISSSNTYDWFKITTNNNGKLIVEMTPSAADLDLEVGKETFIGGGCNNLVQVGTSTKSGASKETITANVIAGYTYWIKTYYSSGSATGTVTAKLVECTANDALDAACPSAKPYCSSNKCVECLSNDITYSDANTNNDRSSQCTDVAKPRCSLESGPRQYACVPPEPCNTNADCILGECCTADSSLGEYADLPNTGKCRPHGSPIGRFICTGS